MAEKFGFVRCDICGGYGWSSTHKCPPKWSVWLIDDYHDPEDTRDEYRGTDAEDAAIKFAEEWDQEDHNMMQGAEIHVAVETVDGVQIFRCSGEAEPTYYAERDTEKEAEHGSRDEDDGSNAGDPGLLGETGTSEEGDGA